MHLLILLARLKLLLLLLPLGASGKVWDRGLVLLREVSEVIEHSVGKYSCGPVGSVVQVVGLDGDLAGIEESKLGSSRK